VRFWKAKDNVGWQIWKKAFNFLAEDDGEISLSLLGKSILKQMAQKFKIKKKIKNLLFSCGNFHMNWG